MGFSYNAFAGVRYDSIQNFCQKQTGQSNVFESRGNKYMIEWSNRSRRDGAITGSIHKYLDNDLVRKTGRIVIHGDGTVEGPAILKNLEAYAAVYSKNGIKVAIFLWEDKLDQNLLKSSASEFGVNQVQLIDLRDGKVLFNEKLQDYSKIGCD